MTQSNPASGDFSFTHSLRQPWFWLLALAMGLVAIYMTLVDRSQDTAHWGMSALFWLAVGSLLWDRRHSLKLAGDLPGTLTGGLLIVGVLWSSHFLIESPYLIKSRFPELCLLRLSPFFSTLGMALIASGFQQVRQFWRELIISFFMGIPSIIALTATDISPITARVSTFWLWYSGFTVTLQDNFIYLVLSESKKGAVEVYEGCSGMEAMTYLLGLSVVALVMFPIAAWKRWFIPPLGILIGFGVNSIRVCLMAILVASGDRDAFVYWHEGDGSLIFGLIAVLIFGGLYMMLLNLENASGSKRKAATEAMLARERPVDLQEELLLWPGLEDSGETELHLPGLDTSDLSDLSEMPNSLPFLGDRSGGQG